MQAIGGETNCSHVRAQRDSVNPMVSRSPLQVLNIVTYIVTPLDHRHCAVVIIDMPDAGIYQNLVGTHVGIYHAYIPVFNQSDCSICYNYDLIHVRVRYEHMHESHVLSRTFYIYNYI